MDRKGSEIQQGERESGTESQKKGNGGKSGKQGWMGRRGEHRERPLLGMRGWDGRREAEDQAVQRGDLVLARDQPCFPLQGMAQKAQAFAILI